MLFEDVIERVRYGSRFNTDIEKRIFKLDGEEISLEDLGIPVMELKESLMLIENHYAKYKKSVPSERNTSKRNRYFIADKLDDLSDKDLCSGISREEAQADIELLTLGLIINGSLFWDDKIMGGNWFWKSKKYPELIILRDWLKEN